jgi:protoporphyrinogen oxidase
MTLAHRLSAAGERVTLFEAADHLGGLADAWSCGDVVWDRHYHVTLLSDTHLRGLLGELGLADDLNWVETKTGFYTDGRLHSMSNTLEFLRFSPLDLLSKLRLGGTIFYASRLKNWRRLERILVEDWLRRWSGDRAVDKIWLPLLRAKLGDNYRITSAAFIWATIARMYAARRTGLKKEMFGYLKGGYARMLARFSARLAEQGVEIRLSHPIERVERADPASDRPTGSGPRLRIVSRGQPAEEFSRVVLTCPAPIVTRLCPQLSEDERARYEQIQYQGILCASVLLRHPLDRFYVTNITDPGLPFTAVIEMTALVDRSELNGHTLVYLPKYVPAGDASFKLSDDELRESFVAALERMYPHFDRQEVLAFRVSRVRQVVALSTLDYSRRLPPMETSLPGLFVVNSAHIVNGTLNVNETIRLADDAIRGVLHPGLQPRTRQAPSAAERPSEAPVHP